MRDQMIALMTQLRAGEGISLEDFREVTYKEREFLFNEIQYWCLYEKDILLHLRLARFQINCRG